MAQKHPSTKHQGNDNLDETDTELLYYQNILQTTHDGFWLLNSEGRIIDVNEAYCKMVGYTKAELLQLHISDLDVWEDPATTAARMQHVMDHGSDLFATVHRKKDGTLINLEFSVSFLKMDGGQFICFCRDISERMQVENELRANKAALEKAQQVAHIGNWVWNIKTNQLSWSQEMYHIFGIDPLNFSGSLADVIQSAIHPEDRDKVERSNRSVIQDKKPYPIEYRIIWPDQSVHVVWAEAGELELDEQGEPAILTGIVQDITARKQIEQALRESEEHFHLMYERSPLGYQSLDDHGNFIEVNQAWLDILGYQREEVIGHWFGDFLIPEMVDAFRERFPRFKADGEVHNQFQMVHKDGQIITVAFDGKIGHDESGGFKQTHCILRDITEQQKLKDALQESELKYRTLVDSGQALIWTSGTDMGCDYFSEAWLKFTGRTLAQELGNGWIESIHPEDVDQCLQHYTAAFENRESFTMEYRLQHHSGEYHWVQDTGTPRYDSSGIFVGYIGHCLDIDALKQVEEALRTNNEMFAQFMRHSPIYIFIKEVTETKSRVLQASENFVDMVGIPGSQMTGKCMEELFPPEFARKITADDWDVVSKGIVFRENEVLNGRTYITIKFPIFQGDKSFLAGYTIDITDQKQTEEALRRSEERYQLIDEASQDLIYSFDCQGRFTHANTSLCKQLGLALDEIIGKTHAELGFPAEQCEEWAVLHQQVYKTNSTVIAETSTPIQGSEPMYSEVVLNPMHDANGEVIGIAGTTRDIHARKLAEAKVKEQLEELRRWHQITMGREERILELKREVNALLSELGKPPLYGSVDRG
jgi:PAS domain S-box-containing protein